MGGDSIYREVLDVESESDEQLSGDSVQNLAFAAVKPLVAV